MSVVIPAIALGGVALNSPSTFNFAPFIQTSNVNAAAGSNATMVIINGSFNYVRISFPVSHIDSVLGPGQRSEYAIQSSETQFTWTLTTSQGSITSPVIIPVWYGPGEPVEETFLGVLSGAANVTVAQQVVQTNENAPNDLVISSPLGYATVPTVDIKDDGTVIIRGLANNVESTLLQITPSTTADITVNVHALAIMAQGPGSGQASNAQIDLLGTNIQYWTPQSGAAGAGKFWHEFITWNGSAAVAPLGIGDGANGSLANPPMQVSNAGAINQLGGQPSVGSFGAPVIIAQAINQAVTTTAGVSPINITCPATGLYRFNLAVTLNNGTSPATVGGSIGFTDPNTNAGIGVNFSVNNGTIQSFSSLSMSNGDPCPFPIVAYCKSGGIMKINYQDATGTPNDHITAFIERLA